MEVEVFGKQHFDVHDHHWQIVEEEEEVAIDETHDRDEEVDVDFVGEEL